PPPDLAELNAASWTAWAEDGEPITIVDDQGFTVVGQASLRIEVSGGFDNYVRYPVDQSARWDLSSVQFIHVWFYAINPNEPGFQSYSPWIRLGSADGYFEWRPNDDGLNQAIGQWVEFVIPITGDGVWQRYEEGTPSLAPVHYIEIHADTWGYGFTLWMDGLGFEPNPQTGSADCNTNGVPDECDVAGGTSSDADGNGTPDECQGEDCNDNGVEDAQDIAAGTSVDCQPNGIPDECEIGPAALLLGELTDPQNMSVPPYIDVVYARIEQHGKALIFTIQTRGNIPTTLPEPDDVLTFLWLVDADQNPDTGQPHGALGSEFNVRVVVGETYGGAFVDVTGGLPGGGIGAWAVSDNTVTMTIGLDQIASPQLFNWRCDAGGYVTGVGNINNGGETAIVSTTTSALSADCNSNNIPDECDTAAGTSADINNNDLPDECEVAHDCNHNGVADADDIAAGTSQDCQTNGIPDECETDCNDNGVPDDCDLAQGTSRDCNSNGTLDECDMTQGHVWDCNTNSVPDECDVAAGTSRDCQPNGIPDDCELGAVYQPLDFSASHNGRLQDSDGGFPEGDVVLGGVPFSIPVGGNNCWTSGSVPGPNPIVLDIPVNLPGALEVHTLINTGWGQPGPTAYAWLEFFGSAGAYYHKDLIGNVDIRDWNQASWTNSINGTTTINVVLLGGHRLDKQQILLPAEFLDQRLVTIRLTDVGAGGFSRAFLAGVTVLAGGGLDCNANAVPDECDLAGGTSLDCQPNGTPDECDLAEGDRADCNSNAIPDECEMVTSGVLYTLDEWSTLSTVNPQTGEVTWVADLSPSAQATYGLAFGPGPGGQLYAVIDANSTGELVVVNPTTGEWSSKGILPESVEDTAWGSDGQLYGVLFSAQFVPGEVVIINPTDASISHPGIAVSGGDRQSIAFKPGTRLLYHTSDADGNGQSQLEVMDLTTGVAQPIGPELQHNYLALVYDPATDLLIGASDWWYYSFWTIDPTTGTETYLGTRGERYIGVLYSGLTFGIVVQDCNTNGVLDECEPDCNTNGKPDECDITAGTSIDTNANGIPDECEVDLDVTLCSAPGTVDAGLPLNVAWTVTNIGGLEAVGSWTDTVYLSDDDIVGNDVPLDGFLHGGPLAAGGFYEQAQAVAIAGHLAGDFWIIVATDTGNAVDEVRQDNNARVCGSLTINDTQVPETSITSGPPEGSNVNTSGVSLGWTGQDNHTPVGQLEYAYCLALVASGCDPGAGPFAAETSVAFSDLTQESSPYVFKVVARDQAGNVDPMPATRTFTVDWTGVTVTGQVPSGSVNEAVCAVRLTFSEQPYDFTVSDVTLTGPSGPIAVTSVVNVLNPQTYEFRFACQSEPGTYNFAVGPNIFDAVGNPMAEPYASSFAIAMPDLVPVALDVPTNGVSGTPITVSWTVENRGSIPATGTWKDAIYLSSDAGLSGDDRLLGEFSFSGPFAEGGSYQRIQSMPLPTLLEGDFWIIVVVDARANVVEVHEGADNHLASLQTVHLTLLPYPDLQVTAVSGPPAAWTGQQVTLCWTVTNAGIGATGVPLWNDDVYLSFNQSLDAGDYWLARFENPSSLGSGESYEQCQTVTIPSGALGCYYFLVRTDSLNHVFEYRTDLNAEANNDGSSGGPEGTDPCTEVSLPPPSDVQVTSVIAPASGWSGEDISVTWQVTNKGELPTPV
ncbi:MAG: CARDB domain-containing protein, partial [Planctomycetota bacterium]